MEQTASRPAIVVHVVINIQAEQLHIHIHHQYKWLTALFVASLARKIEFEVFIKWTKICPTSSAAIWG